MPSLTFATVEQIIVSLDSFRHVDLLAQARNTHGSGIVLDVAAAQTTKQCREMRI
jgi:hypothetical protein